MTSIALVACGPGIKNSEPPVQYGYPKEDVLFDCELREAQNAYLPPDSWSARNDEVERFGWLLAGSTTLLADPDMSRMQDSGPVSVFYSQGFYRSFVDWPKRLEFGATSSTARDANREDEFKTLSIDLAQQQVSVVVTNYEWPHGGDRNDRFITGGYLGNCRLVEGDAAARQFEELE